MIPELTPGEIARFYSKIQVGGCGIIWAGKEVHEYGYGQFTIWRKGKRTRILAHRLSFKLFTGNDPGNDVVRHHCDTPPCVTPDCLELGTQADNVQDAISRGRLNITGLTAYREVRDAEAAARVITGEKRCSRCRKVKKMVSNFALSSRSIDGHAYWCKACIKAHKIGRSHAA